MTTWYERREDIAVLQIDNPPVNGLGHATRVALAEGLARARADGKVLAIVITGTDRVFSGGADIREFNTPGALAEPNLLQLIDLIEKSGKPVVAALNGVCMGGGLEIALACHYRVATPDASIGLPEVKLGLIPGAGGTQRLPRAIGAEKALRMITSGNPIGAEDALDHGLIERIVERTSFQGALDFAHEVAERRSHPKLRDKEVALPLGAEPAAFFAAARQAVAARGAGPDRAAQVRRCGRGGGTAPLRGRHAIRAPDLRRADQFDRIARAASCLLRRARRGEDSRPARGHADPADPHGGRARLRHHGRRHRHEFRERRHPGDGVRARAGRARSRHERSAAPPGRRRSRRAA